MRGVCQGFFRVIRPHGLAGRGGKSDAIINGAGVPRLTDAKTDHIADPHVHHHLRRRHDYRTDIGKGLMPALASQ
jgi:hypothetical protein